jgi:hydroxymethylglutaryl-CoA lyase
VGGPLTWPRSARVREVGPRDGIQGERAAIATDDKVRLIDALGRAGLRRIEAVSFVSPTAVPQMADAAEVWARLPRRPGVLYSALVPNRRGAEAAVEAGVDSLQMFVAATDSYNLANVRRTVSQSLHDVGEVVDVARRAGIPVEGTISTAFGCPYEGDVSPQVVADVSKEMSGRGVDAISYGDTTGMATPRRVVEVVEAVRDAVPGVDLNMHFHDTRGTALANVVTALELGVDYFDASVGGMGGSPFAAGATGNVATEDLVHMLEDMEIDTGVDLGALLDAARLAQELVASPLPSRLLRAGPRTARERSAPRSRAGDSTG